MLVSINRKNFLRTLADRETEAALPVSLAATAMAVERGAHVVRTHDVAETRDAALVGAEFARSRARRRGDVALEELDVTTAGEARRHLDRIGAATDTADDAVSRVFEFDGLSPADTEALAAAAETAGATFVAGSDGTAALLVGTSAALEAVPSSLDSGSPALEDALAAMADALEY
jgi:dihydropteroate synthase